MELKCKHNGHVAHVDFLTLRSFVCCTSGETQQTSLLRSWHTSRGDPDLYRTARIWEAARATSAASSFFDAINIGDPKQRFLDGGTGANNPVQHVWNEAADLLTSEQSLSENLGCLLSIGTGQPGYKPFEDSLVGIGKTLLHRHRNRSQCQHVPPGSIQAV